MSHAVNPAQACAASWEAEAALRAAIPAVCALLIFTSSYQVYARRLAPCVIYLDEASAASRVIARRARVARRASSRVARARVGTRSRFASERARGLSPSSRV